MSGLWLGIDGALGPFSAALVARDGSRPPRSAAAAGKDALERGLAIIEEALDGTPLSELGGIAVGTGPGTFTGLRIALSYAKSLALATGSSLAGVSSFDALEPAVAEEFSATFVEGRPGFVSVRLRARGGFWRTGGAYAAVADALAAHFPGVTTLVSYGAAEGVTSALGERGITVRCIALDREVPAINIARRAPNLWAGDGPHAVQADYGEADYAARAGLLTTP